MICRGLMIFCNTRQCIYTDGVQNICGSVNLKCLIHYEKDSFINRKVAEMKNLCENKNTTEIEGMHRKL